MTVPPDDPMRTDAFAPGDTPHYAGGAAQSLPAVPERYRVEAVLGRGGMGVVRLAFDTVLGRRVALKSILESAFADDESRSRFVAEARAAARLEHPGFVRVHEVGEHDGRPFLSLEYCPGGGLDAVLAKSPLPPRRAAEIVRALAEAMQTAHDANVVHRDLKPSNVLIDANGSPRVGDFGLAKRLDEPGLTHTGAVVGTPSYMSPEQARGAAVGPATDVWALGAVLYACLTGRPPFRATTTMDTLLLVLAEDPVPPRTLVPATPIDLETVALTCLRKEIPRRYATAAALADDLGRYLRGEPIRARPTSAVERFGKWVRRNRAVSFLAASTLLALVAGTAVSTTFAVIAWREAGAARKAEIATKVEKTRAETQLARTTLLLYAAKLAEARRGHAAGDGAAALRALEECPADLRGWEHDYLRSVMDARQSFAGHLAAAVAWSADGALLVSAGEDRTVVVRDAYTGKVVASWLGDHGKPRGVFADGRHVTVIDIGGRIIRREIAGGVATKVAGPLRTVKSAAWSPDGQRLLVHEDGGRLTLDGVAHAPIKAAASCWAGDGKTFLALCGASLVVFDGVTGREVRRLGASGDDAHVVAWSPDGRRVAVSGDKPDIRVLDAATGKLLSTHRGHETRVDSLAWGAHGRLLSAGSDYRVKVWDTSRGGGDPARPADALDARCLAFDDAGSRLFVGVRDGPAVLLDARTRRRVPGFDCPAKDVVSAVWLDDGRRLWTFDPPRLIDAATGRVLLEPAGEDVFGNSAALSPDGKWIAVASAGDTVTIRNARTGAATKVLPGVRLEGRTRIVRWADDGRHIYAGGDAVEFLVPTDGGPPRPLSGHSKQILSASIRRDKLLTGGYDRAALIRHVSTGEVLATMRGHEGRISSAAFSPDGRRVATVGSDGLLVIHDAATGFLLLSLAAHPDAVDHVAWSSDGRTIVTVAEDGTMRFFDSAPGPHPLVLTGHDNVVRCATFDAAGEKIVTGGNDKTVVLHDARTGATLLRLTGHADAVTAAAFRPDGRALVTASIDGTARVWDAVTGRTIRVLSHDGRGVCSAAWNHDGSKMLTAGYDGTIRVRDGRSGDETRTLGGFCKVVTCAAWSPDGRHIFSGDDEGRLHLHEASQGTLKQSVQRHATGVVRIAFDGNTVTTWDVEDRTSTWDAETLEAATAEEVPPASGVLRSADGRRRARIEVNRVTVTDAAAEYGRAWPRE